jgi:hypothetical protein
MDMPAAPSPPVPVNPDAVKMGTQTMYEPDKLVLANNPVLMGDAKKSESQSKFYKMATEPGNVDKEFNHEPKNKQKPFGPSAG